MSKITTADCKKFLADCFKNNFNLIDQDMFDPDDTDLVINLGSQSDEWIRQWKSKPTSSGMDWYSTKTGFKTAQGEKLFAEISAVRTFTRLL
jgi:hypothetical protein